jgi:hypothetical protein
MPGFFDKALKGKKRPSRIPEPTDKARDDLSRLREETPGLEKVDLMIGHVYKENYALGRAEKENANVREMRKKQPETLIGSVDATRFAMKWHRPKWYRKYLDASLMMSNCYELLDAPTKKWFDELKPVIEGFVELRSLSKRRFRRKYKNKIWKLVKTHGKDSIYGPKGIFNLCLAWRRILNTSPVLKKAMKKDFKVADLNVEKIKLRVGKGKGRKGGKKDRYAVMTVRKKGAKASKQPQEPETAQKQLKKLAPGDYPAFMSQGFVDMFKFKDEAELDRFIAYIESSAEFVDKLKDFKDPKYFEKADESEIDELFRTDKTLGIQKLVSDLASFKLNFFDFFNSNHPRAILYQELYFWANAKLLDFFEKDVNLLDDPDVIESIERFIKDNEAFIDEESGMFKFANVNEVDNMDECKETTSDEKKLIAFELIVACRKMEIREPEKADYWRAKMSKFEKIMGSL